MTIIDGLASAAPRLATTTQASTLQQAWRRALEQDQARASERTATVAAAAMPAGSQPLAALPGNPVAHLQQQGQMSAGDVGRMGEATAPGVLSTAPSLATQAVAPGSQPVPAPLFRAIAAVAPAALDRAGPAVQALSTSPALLAGAPQQWQRRKLTLQEYGDGVRIWIRDAALMPAVALMLAGILERSLQAQGKSMTQFSLNGSILINRKED